MKVNQKYWTNKSLKEPCGERDFLMHGLRRSKIVILCKTEPKYYISSKFLIKFGTFTNPWFHNQKYAGCLFSNKDDWRLKNAAEPNLTSAPVNNGVVLKTVEKLGDDLRPVAPWRRPPAPWV